MQGSLGEYYVREKLEKLDKKKYSLFHDVTLRNKNGKLTQIDHIVISPFGLFVIETKSCKGRIFGNEYMEEWVRYVGRYKWSLYNPIKQNYGHIKALKHLLNLDIEFISVICFAAYDVNVNVTTKTADVIYLDALDKTIKKYKDISISAPQRDHIVEKIKKASLLGIDVQEEHLRHVKHVARERKELQVSSKRR